MKRNSSKNAPQNEIAQTVLLPIVTSQNKHRIQFYMYLSSKTTLPCSSPYEITEPHSF